jgi:hypothetical protein
MSNTVTKPSVAELLKPRYKVIADYPNQWHRTGAIITDLFYDDQYKDESWFAQYPAIFQRLEWWQEISESEMPEYLKITEIINGQNHIGKIFRTIPGHLRAGYPGFANDSLGRISSFDNIRLDCFLPATEQDYLAYISTTPTSGKG